MDIKRRNLAFAIITAWNGSTPQGMAWTTPIDKLFNQKAFFYTFVGIIVGTTALTLFSDSPIGKTNVRKQTVIDPNSNGGYYGRTNLYDRSRELVNE